MKIEVSGNLLRFTGFQKAFDYTVSTVGEGLESLIGDCPDLGEVLMDSDGNLRRIHLVVLNGVKITPEEVDKSVGANAELLIVTAIAGG